MNDFNTLFNQIQTHPDNLSFTRQGISPLYATNPLARICIIGQAPGLTAQTTRLHWNDPSGDRLRLWMGRYAMAHYLELSQKETLTHTVANYKTYLPRYFPLPHPSPRNNIWLRHNPWFEAQVVPHLQETVHAILQP